MDIQKPIRMLGGMDKIVLDEDRHFLVAACKREILSGWAFLSEEDQNELYTEICNMFATAAYECLRSIVGQRI